jgi:predicted enzyme related to lactoylglutathione lyase
MVCQSKIKPNNHIKFAPYGRRTSLPLGRLWQTLCASIRDSSMNEHEKLSYVEFPSSNLQSTKAFFEKAFGWSFVDYGPEYTAFSGQGLDGGFFQASMRSSTENGAALLVFFSNNLEGTLAKVVRAGGKVVKPIFSFPGGRRFHFTEPSGNEFAVWSEAGA